MDILEQEAAKELRKLGFKSTWGCKEGVFVSSEDAFKMIRIVKAFKKIMGPQEGEAVSDNKE